MYEDGKLVKTHYERTKEMKNKMYTGKTIKVDIDALAQEYLDKGYVRYKTEFEQRLESATKEQLVAMCDTLKPKDWK